MQAPDDQQATYREDLALICEAGAIAADIAMRYFDDVDALDVTFKHGNSPVSAGDFAVDAYLRETLLAARPGFGWLSEETLDDDPGHRMNALRTFVVDPIDGTRAYISGRSTWCISIAVVEGTQTVAGVLVCPVLKQTYAASLGGGATLNGIPLPSIAAAKPAMQVTGRHALIERLANLSGLNVKDNGHVPSLAYRIAMVADGRLGGTFIRANSHDWDIAAAALILREAGGDIVVENGRPVAFNAHDHTNPDMVAAHPSLLDIMLRVAES